MNVGQLGMRMVFNLKDAQIFVKIRNGAKEDAGAPLQYFSNGIQNIGYIATVVG